MTIVDSILKHVPAYEKEVLRFGGPEWFNLGWYGALGALWDLAYKAAKEQRTETVRRIYNYVESILAEEQDQFLVDAFSIEMIEPLALSNPDPDVRLIISNLGPASQKDLSVKLEYLREKPIEYNSCG